VKHPTYRILTKEELEPLEKEFVHFLILQGITASDWLSIKENEPVTSQDMIVSFSDMIFEKILNDVHFLIHHVDHVTYHFQCNKSDMTLIVEEDALEEDKLRFSSTSKSYIKPRNKEIFELIESGCQIDNGQMFKRAALLFADTR
jgi:hypothetical protein